MVGHGEDELPASRARHRASLATACRTRSARSTSCSPRAGSASRSAATARSPARPTARAAASTGRSATSSPAGATSRNPEHREYIAGVWGVDETEICPGPASMPTSCSARSTPARSRACCRICFNPKVSLPDNDFVTRCAREARVLRRDRLLPERHRPPRRHRAARHPAGGGRGHRHAGRRARHQDQQGGRLPRRGAAGLAHHPGHRPRARPAARVHVRRARARSSRSCASPARAASPTTPASPTRRSSSSTASSGRAPATIRRRARRRRPSRHAAAVRAGQLQPGREGRRAVLLPRRQGALQRRRLPAAGRGRRRRVSRSS